LILSLTLATFAGFKSMESLREDDPSNVKSLIWISLFGVFTGLAGQSKNNGLVIFIAGVIILMLLTIRIKQGPLSKLKFCVVGLTGMTIATFLFFVGPNPILWKHPIKTSIELVPYRIGLLQRQAQAYPQSAIFGWKESIQVIPSQVFRTLTPFNFFGSGFIKFGLACLGLWLIAARAGQSWKAGRLDAGPLAILITGVIATVPSLFTPLNWSRYFIIPVYFVSILMAIGINYLMERSYLAGGREGI